MAKAKKFNILKALSWFLVLFNGIALGAGLYEWRVELPRWLTVTDGVAVWHADIAKAADPGLHFWAFVTTGPMTLLTLISLIVVWKTNGAVKKWLLVFLGFIVIDRLMTFSYFIPTMVNLMSGTIAQADAVRIAQQWSNLDVVRLIASLGAFLAAIKLLIESYTQGPTPKSMKRH